MSPAHYGCCLSWVFPPTLISLDSSECKHHRGLSPVRLVFSCVPDFPRQDARNTSGHHQASPGHHQGITRACNPLQAPIQPSCKHRAEKQKLRLLTPSHLNSYPPSLGVFERKIVGFFFLEVQRIKSSLGHPQ